MSRHCSALPNIPTSAEESTSVDVESPRFDQSHKNGQNDMAEPCCQPIEMIDGASQRAHWDVQLLEGGIVFHSVMMWV